jgi:adenosylcobyric acid synthase
MDSLRYREFRKSLWGALLEPFNRLSSANDYIIIEGAGSPVELNLNDGDIVNMGLASKVGAPVLLAADIDRGGVFASVYGTLGLFSPEERSLVKGIIINRCKGGLDSFADVKAEMERLTNLPVLGLVPYTDIGVEDEDDLIDANTGRKTSQSPADMNAQLDALDKTLRSCLDLEAIMSIAERGV